MVEISKFTHFFDCGEAIALYHSLRMKPVYLKKDVFEKINIWLEQKPESVESAPEDLSEIVNELVRYKILKRSHSEDEKVLDFVKSKLPKPAINVCYFILSEQCNLACKYCFVGNNDKEKRQKFIKSNMTKEIADQAIDFFIRQLKESSADIDFEENKPVIIFYGGEPLLNFEVLEYIATKIDDIKKSESIIKNIEMSVITNGLLLNEKNAIKLKELGINIGISIDGFTEQSNSMRVDNSGKPIFKQLLSKLDMLKRNNINISLSVTLSEETINSNSEIINLIKQYDIKSLGFNIMMSSDTFIVPKEYNEKVAQFIIDQFIKLRKIGVYEDRMMRKLKSFAESKIYFSDCAATAGGQIVIAPNGEVGICQGCLHNKKYFISNIKDLNFKAKTNQDIIEWSKLSPINKQECQECSALGICGGGCPINASYLKQNNTIHSLDERFCIHSKMTLNFLIQDLYRVIKNDQSFRN